mmetsp:Transcript_43195/g.71753  ORF Transcript_43195/g.71753 Transcript_43195/m.71753 type:complete len:212 (+) Transcript_43195:1759-2394(+)
MLNHETIQYNQSVVLRFHDQEYIMHGFIDEKGDLVIEAEQKQTHSRWFGIWSPKALEELTRKTGNFKHFPVFVKMLSKAFAKDSENVFVELLTYQDLESLQQRKKENRGETSSRSSRSRSKSNKRYLILTYIMEFDKVHYPLRLKYDENPDPKRLIRTIARLRDELSASQEARASQPSHAKLKAEMLKVQQENEKLKSLMNKQSNSEQKKR